MISILIVNWNGQEHLCPCVQSILDKVTVPHEIIVVDNHSTDGSADLLAARFPSVKLIRSQDNLGFAGGNNLAARHASGKYLLLLNNDTRLNTDLTDALAAMEADPRIGALGAAMFGRDGEPRLSCQHFPVPSRLWLLASLLHTPSDPWPSASGIPLYKTDVVEGSFLLTPAACWRQLGGIDEFNYMYGEDIEYCRSIANLGLQTVFCPSVQYTHFGGYQHSRMAYVFGGFRRYHRKFSSRFVQQQADFVLRAGLLLRLPLYWAKARFRNDPDSRAAFTNAIELHRHWADTLVDAHRYHS